MRKEKSSSPFRRNGYLVDETLTSPKHTIHIESVSFIMTKFTEHINNDHPTFKCFAAGNKEENEELLVTVKNIINHGATEKDLELLKSNLQLNNNELIDFYTKHNGLKLYCQKEEASLEFFPIHELETANKEWKSWLEGLEADEMYEFQQNGVAFGQVSGSGNYFIIYNGQIFYSDHDEWEEVNLGITLNSFLDNLATNPAQMLEELGCYSRFSDGKTDKQWIPKSYHQD